jgi:hypothetical protein
MEKPTPQLKRADHRTLPLPIQNPKSKINIHQSSFLPLTSDLKGNAAPLGQHANEPRKNRQAQTCRLFLASLPHLFDCAPSGSALPPNSSSSHPKSKINIHQSSFLPLTSSFQVSGLRSQVSGLRSQVSGLRSQVSALSSQLSALSSQLSALSSQLSFLLTRRWRQVGGPRRVSPTCSTDHRPPPP